MSWIVKETGFDPERTATNGSKFMIGNGRYGYRGTLEEFGKKELAAVIPAGLYDQAAGRWREPVNLPNGLHTRIYADGVLLSVQEGNSVLEHSQQLDLKAAVHGRRTVFAAAGGSRVTFEAQRFASAKRLDLLAAKCSLTAEEDCEIVIVTGIDGDVWDINGPHLEDWAVKETAGCLVVTARTQELGVGVAVAETAVFDFEHRQEIEPAAGGAGSASSSIFRRISFTCRAGETYSWTKYVSLHHELERAGGVEPAGGVWANGETRQNGQIRPIRQEAQDQPEVLTPGEAAMQSSLQAARDGYNRLLEEHAACWNREWERVDVKIEGDEEAQFGLRYSLYQLLIIAPGDSERVSIPARGLSGQVYKGAVFWDTEMFMLPFFLLTRPEVARNLMMYRVHTLPGAKRKAAEYGFQGAFYAWESQDSGDDACTLFNVNDVFTGRPMRTYFRDKQVHISADVVHGIWQYYLHTGDDRLLMEGGAEVIWEVARFYYSYAYYNVYRERFEILDVTGPDEYHERVNNNAFTNRLVKKALSIALQTEELLSKRNPELHAAVTGGADAAITVEKIRELHDGLYVPEPDAETSVIEQFDGYFKLEDVSLADLKKRVLHPSEYWGGGNGLATTTQIIKQADVVLMLHLFKEEFSQTVKKANWDYYEPRTEHGSSLSPCVYALVAADTGSPDWAYPYFMRTATIDLTGDSKQYVGDLYIGGTHPAANGGAWMAAVQGFAGIHVEPGLLQIRPSLPSGWKAIEFTLNVQGQSLRVHVSAGEVKLRSLSASAPEPAQKGQAGQEPEATAASVEYEAAGGLLPAIPGAASALTVSVFGQRHELPAGGSELVVAVKAAAGAPPLLA
ncbi:kojibiose phosphorylase [Paenibacillus yonginensis]|uniref:Kojibiose phosphorylase n=1 Tax=Paenibacillus yonginensis TaxID=1462996 RepID=A0A1B1N691_9BACL|nr:glycosyl hydrolase family 65 protein [Paenibacillus yonginensis]ANS76950.1 kojibiose phosphorylase [Paenibacillus yonginensis]